MKPVNLGFRVLGKWRVTTGMICQQGGGQVKRCLAHRVHIETAHGLTAQEYRMHPYAIACIICMHGSTPGSTSTPLLAHTAVH